jgi:energy-coupling factor transport system ATP-binding protein
MQAIHLDVPQVTLLGHLLLEKGLDIPEGILTREELAQALRRQCGCRITAERK